MPSTELTLIVAASRNMGIGFQGTMPWKGLRKEMQYFATVTKHIPPSSPSPVTTTTTTSSPINAVIMGRKTWDSIPPKFRPLKDRLNIIITRSATSPPPFPSSPSEPIRMPSLDHAISYLSSSSSSTTTTKTTTTATPRIFVIGGTQIYAAALERPEAKRVLLTSIDKDFECDVFFPLDLTGDGSKAPGWVRRSREELQDWTGQEIAKGGVEEAGMRYEFQMWEKEETDEKVDGEK